MKKKKKITRHSLQFSNKATPFLLPMCQQAPQLTAPIPNYLKSLKLQTKQVIPLGSFSVCSSFFFFSTFSLAGAVPTTS
jgi:hypothetical protein